MAYTLQVFAVIILVGYAVASPKNEPNEKMDNEVNSVQISRDLLFKAAQDSAQNIKINELRRYIVKRW